MIIQSALRILYYILLIYSYIMILDIIISWIPSLYRFRIFRLVHYISNGYLGFFSGRIVIGFLDITPMIGFFVYYSLLDMFAWMIYV